MEFPGKLLSLSIKTQIIWTVVISSIICVILTYAIINLYIYEMKEESLRNYIEYYYSLQNEVLQNIITFQNFYLFNYEDSLKILICQIVLLVDVSKYFNQSESNKIANFSFNNLNYSNISQSIYIDNDNNSNSNIFYVNDKNIINDNDYNDDFFLNMAFRITNALKSFRIPYYGDYQLFDGVLVYTNQTKKLYSSNNAFLYKVINDEIGNNDFNEYYSNLRYNITNKLALTLDKILTDNNIIPELTITEEVRLLIKFYEANKNIGIFTKYTPFIDYKKEYLHLIKLDEDGKEIYVSMKLKSGLIDNIFMKIMQYYNSTTILMTEDNNILNIMSCHFLLIQLKYYLLSKNGNLEELIEILKQNQENFLNNNITIDKCLLDNENIDLENYYQKYLIQNLTLFYDLDSGYNSSFIQLSDNKYGKEYMITRYGYPDYLLIERKRPKYLIINYINAFTFMNFYFSDAYVNDKSEYLLLNFYTITFSNWLLWIILFIIIFFICLKISRDITGPLIKLKKAIEQMSFNDEKIFEYKDDDNINELFVMCKELVNKDEFKKSLKEKTFLNSNQTLEGNGNINYLNMGENEDNTSVIRHGANRNLIINNQILENNRKILNLENKTSFDKEILVYKDFKLISRTRPRNHSRKRTKTINKLINQNFDFDIQINPYSRHQTKEDYNINSKLRDNFLRESIISTSTKKESKISFSEAKIMNEISNKNDNELNILLYELLFCLGKNMFKPQDIDKLGKPNKYIKSDKSLISNNDVNSFYNDSIKTFKIHEDYNNKYYNYGEPIFENNDTSDAIYEEKKSFNDMDKENKNKYLKDLYQINFKKNDLYYKYLKAKNNWNNKFLKLFKNVHDLELDSNAMVELDDEDNNTNSLLPRKNLKRSELNTIGNSSSLFNKNIDKKESNKVRTSSNLKKSIIKNKNKTDKRKIPLRKSISMPMHMFGKEITNPNQTKLGMRASVALNTQKNKNLEVSLTKKTKFNLNSNNNK